MITSEFFLKPAWSLQFSKLISGFSLPVMGNQALTRKSRFLKTTTQENRINLAQMFNIDPQAIFSPLQIHSNTVLEVKEVNKGQGAFSKANALQGDACITNQKGIKLITSWADCIPVLLFDPQDEWIATIHSGWRGTQQGIVEKTIETLRLKGVRPDRLYAAVGPGIKSCCYEVGEEFKTLFADRLYADCFNGVGGKLYFNLSRAVYLQLIRARVLDENIDYYQKCTCCSHEPSFFSNRKDREKFEGQAAFIYLSN